jgi:hypothetical protein
MDTKKTISFSVNSDNLDFLDEKSNNLGMTRSSYLNMIISEYRQSKNLVQTLPELISVLSDLDKQLKNVEKEKEV